MIGDNWTFWGYWKVKWLKYNRMTINKGLFAHIVVTIGVVFFWFDFVKSTRPELKHFRLDEYYFLTLLLLVNHLTCSISCLCYNLYKQKIKLWKNQKEAMYSWRIFPAKNQQQTQSASAPVKPAARKAQSSQFQNFRKEAAQYAGCAEMQKTTPVE